MERSLIGARLMLGDRPMREVVKLRVPLAEATRNLERGRGGIVGGGLTTVDARNDETSVLSAPYF